VVSNHAFTHTHSKPGSETAWLNPSSSAKREDLANLFAPYVLRSVFRPCPTLKVRDGSSSHSGKAVLAAGSMKAFFALCDDFEQESLDGYRYGACNI
jgi:hypothetical protein